MSTAWTMWPQARERLFALPNGDLWWKGGPERSLIFELKTDGTYRSPQGYRAALTKVAGAYSLLMHDSGMKYEFSSEGFASKVVDRNGNKIEFFYTVDPASGFNLLSSMLDTKGRVTTFTHNGPNKFTRVTDPAGRQHNYGYNDLRQVTSYTDPAGKITRYEYGTTEPDLSGFLAPIVKIIDPNLNETRFTYSRALDFFPPNSVFDLTSRVTSLTRVTNPATGAGFTTTFEYLPWDSTLKQGKTKVTDPNSNATSYTFDKLGRVIEVLDPLGKTVKTSYWPDGFIKDQTDQAGKTTTSTYAGANLMSVDFPSTMKQSSEFLNTSHPHYPTKGTNAQGSSASFTYDTPGNLDLQQNQLAANNSVDPEYNPNGTLKSTKDGMNNLTTTYDALDRVMRLPR